MPPKIVKTFCIYKERTSLSYYIYIYHGPRSELGNRIKRLDQIFCLIRVDPKLSQSFSQRRQATFVQDWVEYEDGKKEKG